MDLSLAYEAVKVAFVVANVVLLVVWRTLLRRDARTVAGPDASRVLVVVAHPDDEAMFFAPTIAALQELGHVVHVVSLSTGNYDGLGRRRTREMFASCAVLGVPAERVAVVDREDDFSDGPREVWPPRKVADEVAGHLARFKIDAVVTFDRHGVSGHPNHCDVHRGVVQLVRDYAPKDRAGNPIRVYELVTTNIVRKFAGWLDFPISLVAADRIYISPSVGLARRALAQHESQLVWFRHLYIAFSRYAYFNTLRTIAG